MRSLKRMVWECIKLLLIFFTALFIFSYGVSMIQNEYQLRIRELTPRRAADQVSFFESYFKINHLGD
ncbi:hypothetical protein SAMN04488134_10113 [Amphibacillus marinus]|uniref:Uncharacterized protein n=1 Tax=Amphibacillus marinus TaxID=872970 RepID=A0A1H8GA91_9BACI|nr:hypothetical protein SAMN04488134_10113 [Amphibacillus marinus]